MVLDRFPQPVRVRHGQSGRLPHQVCSQLANSATVFWQREQWATKYPRTNTKEIFGLLVIFNPYLIYFALVSQARRPFCPNYSRHVDLSDPRLSSASNTTARKMAVQVFRLITAVVDCLHPRSANRTGEWGTKMGGGSGLPGTTHYVLKGLKWTPPLVAIMRLCRRQVTNFHVIFHGVTRGRHILSVVIAPFDWNGLALRAIHKATLVLTRGCWITGRWTTKILRAGIVILPSRGCPWSWYQARGTWSRTLISWGWSY